MITKHSRLTPPRFAIFCLMASLFSITGCDKRQSPAPVRGPDGMMTSPSQEPDVSFGQTPSGSITSEELPGMTGVGQGIIGSAGKKVALLLPTSGSQASLGQSMQQAAEMALFEKGDEHLELEIIDTKSTPGGAVAAANKAMAEGAHMILGPIFADDVKGVATVARTQNIPVVSFSNNPGVAGNGVFVLGLDPAEQIQAVVQFAMQQGSQSIVVLLPQNPFGDLMVQEVNRLKSGSAPIIQIIFYNPGQKATLQKAFNPLVTLNFDTILIPEGGDNLVSVISALKNLGINLKEKVVLGSAQWDEKIATEVPMLENALIASSDLGKRRPFESQYKTAYGHVPVRIASLAYDGVTMMAVLNKHFPQSPYALDSLTQGRGFEGVDGVFRLKADGRCERKLAILRLTNRGYQMVEDGGRGF